MMCLNIRDVTARMLWAMVASHETSVGDAILIVVESGGRWS
jgi:hypothetical protein